jgi:methyl-accepting chemotaxis protein
LVARSQWYGAIVLGLLAAAIVAAAGLSARLQRHIADPLTALVRGSVAIANGDLSTQVRVDQKDEIGLLAKSFNAMSAGLGRVVAEVRRSTREVAGVSSMLEEAASDMSQEAERQKAAIGDSSSSIEKLSDSILGVNSNVVELAESARETSSSVLEMDASLLEVVNQMGNLGQSIDTTSSGVQEVAASTEQVVKAVEGLQVATDGALDHLGQLGASVEEVKVNAEQSDVLSDDSSQEAAKGMTAVDETADAMGEIATSFGQLQGSVSRLDEKSQAIDAIIQVIVGIAERTSLLSLNASIIAAQAGEHGKSFAVVADEVNGLAERTHRSTSEIEELIRAVQAEIAAAVAAVSVGSQKVEQGVQRSNLAGSILRQILEKAQNTTTRVREIVNATKRQSDDLQRVDHGINNVKEIVQQIDGAAREQQGATSEIARAIENIRALGVGVHESTQEQRQTGRSIADAMMSVTGMIEKIADATKSQAASNETIQHALQVFRDTSEESIRRAGEMTTMVSTLSQRSQTLETEVDRFKID